MFEAQPSLRAPTQAEQRSVPEGPTNPARLFFGDFLLAKQKKVTALSGAHPDTPALPRASKKPKCINSIATRT